MRRTPSAVLNSPDDEDGFSLVAETLAAGVDALAAEGAFVVALFGVVSLFCFACCLALTERLSGGKREYLPLVENTTGKEGIGTFDTGLEKGMEMLP